MLLGAQRPALKAFGRTIPANDITSEAARFTAQQDFGVSPGRGRCTGPKI